MVTRLPNAWRPVSQEPDGALLGGHLGQQHRDQVGMSLDRMRAGEDIACVAAQGYELIEGRGSAAAYPLVQSSWSRAVSNGMVNSIPFHGRGCCVIGS